jgi:shikimate dehydrogenase
MAVVPLLDELDAAAAAVEAVNTIVCDATGRLSGINTDVPGFLRSLTTAGVEPNNTHCVMLGAGGAARAVAFALIDAGARSLTVVNRTPERAEALLSDVLAVTEGEPGLRFLGPSDPDLQQVIAEATILINATSVGLDKQTSPLAIELIAPHLFVVDLIYGKTPLLQMAEQRGAQTQDGLEMLVQQGALAFEAWTGLAAPIDVMRIAARQALEERT